MKNLVLIDDDPDDLDLLSEVIANVNPGVRCHKFTDAREAIAFLDQPHTVKPDYVFTDVNMPMMNGLECVKGLRKTFSPQALNIIVLSTYMPASLQGEFLAIGANEAHQKPASFKAYERLISKIFGTGIGTCL